ncbi:MAG: CRISPR-associated endonuclease Cas2 [Oscillochloridaceae bacterium umkhey_bin13]
MFTIISYDIVNDRRRTKVMHLLKGYGTRVQYSVFECLLNPLELAQLGAKVKLLIDQDTDSVRFYRLDEAAVKRINIYGIGQVTTEPTHWLV